MTPYVVAFIFLLYSTSANAHGSTLKSIAKEISGSENTTHFTVGHVNQLFNKIGFKNCSNASQNLSCQLVGFVTLSLFITFDIMDNCSSS